MTSGAPTIEPTQLALLVMDFQMGTLSGIDDAQKVLETAAGLIEVVRNVGGHVSYVRMALEDDDYHKVPSHTMFARRLEQRGRTLDADAPATQIHEKVAPRPEDIVVRKTRVGAFLTTDLDEQLRAAGVTTLLVAGLTTSGVVLATVIDACDRDYLVYVVSDACAENRPGVHEFLFEHILPRKAHIISSGEVEGLLAGE